MFFFFNDTATTEIYTLSLHDALPIFRGVGAIRTDELTPGGGAQMNGEKSAARALRTTGGAPWASPRPAMILDRKSTRLNSSHANISYAVFCLKKKIKSHKDNTELQ